MVDPKPVRSRLLEAFERQNADRAAERAKVKDRVLGKLKDAFRDVAELEDREAKIRQIMEETGFGHLLMPVPMPSVEMPSVAPALWQNRENKEQSLSDFITTTYGAWMGKGLTRAHVHKLDAPLYNALARWLTVNKTMPEGVDLPTKAEQNTRDLQTAQQQPETLDLSDRIRLFDVAKSRNHRQAAPT